MFELKIDPEDLEVIVGQWDRDSCNIPLKGEETEEGQEFNTRLENAVCGLVLALSGKRLTR